MKGDIYIMKAYQIVYPNIIDQRLSDNRLLRRIHEAKQTIHPAYDMHLNHVCTIVGNGKTAYDIVYNGFTFGYMQGMRATQAQQKPKRPPQCIRQSSGRENIRAYLDQRGITVGQLAEMVYMGRDELESQLTNAHEMPLHVFMFICRVLGESPDAFMIATT